MKRILILVWVVLSFLSCRIDCEPNEFVAFCVKEGNHRFTPIEIKRNRDVVEYEWYFDDSCMYEIEGNDQCDWLKLPGKSYDQFTNHKNSIRGAWRYDINGFWWVAPYYYKNSIAYWADTDCGLQEVTPNDIGAIKVYYGQHFTTTTTTYQGEIASYEITNTTTLESTRIEVDFGDEKPRRETTLWFGGSVPAPHDMCVYRKCLN